MPEKKFKTYANHIWSKPHTYVAVDKVKRKIMDNIFCLDEDEEEDLT
jgi:hypothetical protein